MSGLSGKQLDYIARSTTRVNLAEGSVRASKTYAALVRWLTFVADDAPARGSLLMVGKSRDSLYRNMIEPLEVEPSLAAFAPFVHYRQGAPVARIFGRNVHMMGAADAKAETKIRGMTLAGVMVDEVTTMPREFFRQLLARLSVPGSQMFATTNPDAPRHWLRTEYLNRLGELPDWRVWHFTMEDNPALSDEYKASLRREYSGVWFKRYILGLWVAAEGAIYDMWDGDRHVVRPDQVPVISRIISVGLDYGTTHRTRAYLIGVGDHPVTGPALYVLDEFAPGTATVGQHVQMFKTWLEESIYTAPDIIAVDPAAAAVRQEMFQQGLRPMRAHNAVVSGIQVVASLLASGHLYVVGERCPELVDGLPGYLWDSKAAERGETKPVKQDDDEADALRYAIYTSRHLWRSSIPIAVPAVQDDDEEATMD